MSEAEKISTEIDDLDLPQGHSVFIIDDNPTNLAVLSNYLKDFGYRILVARNGDSALKKLQHVKPDIILLDVMMPGLNGFEVCELLKADEATKEIPVIFMTALSESENKVKGFQAGAVDYVTKPLHHEEVVARLSTHLRIRDLTLSLQEQNERLQKMTDELAYLNASKDKFFSIVAHDLKSPFQALLGMSELLPMLAEKSSAAELKEMGEIIHRSAQNVFNLLQNLLQWSRLQMGRMDYEPTKIDLYELTQGNVDLLAEYAASKSVRLLNDVPENLWVYADENMLNTVIRNLTSNAIKFTPVLGTVTIGAVKLADENADLVEMSVADTGVGISQANINKLFQVGVNYTTLGTAKETGTGLGLIICKEMVEKNKGRIWIESEEGHGTVVKFTVPLR